MAASQASQPAFVSPSTPIPVQIAADSSIWDRISSWVSENKAVVYTIAGVTFAVAAGGVVYYSTSSKPNNAMPKLTKKERRKRKEAEKKAETNHSGPISDATPSSPQAGSSDSADEIPEINEQTVQSMSIDDRKHWAVKLKEAGNRAYGSKDFNKAIGLYSKAILCKPEAVYYSNRAACYNALADWEKVVEDTTAAIALDPEYVKAMNRRANAYDKLERYSDSMLDYTASCIIDGFKNSSSAESFERLLKKFAESKAKEIMAQKPRKLPSPTFVSNYLQSFRSKARPEGLEDSVEFPADTGKGQLQKGLQAMETKTGEGYEEACAAFDKAIELNDLGPYEAFAYNMRGTFTCLRGKHEQALADLTKSIELDPSMTQTYIKRASMNLELGEPDKAEKDFELAHQHDADDPDVYYHRAQFHFIKGEFAEAAKDYQKSIDLDSKFIFSHIQLGVTQYKMGSIASSMATFRRCMKNFSKAADVYNYYGELLLDQGKYQAAIEKFESAIEMEKQEKPTSMNVLPLINKALAIFQEKSDFVEAEKLCQKALIIDPECDIAVATMAQLLLQQGKVTEALEYFERAMDLARTEGELVNAISYVEATRTQIQVQEKYPALAAKLQAAGPTR